jgi:ribonuclease HI
MIFPQPGMSTSANAKPAARPQVTIYTDGGCKPNPGPGGYGVVLLHPKKRAELSGGFRATTNNRMEMFAAIRGLQVLKRPCDVTLYSDSQYLVTAITKGWAAKWKRKNWWLNPRQRAKNIDLWEQLLPLCEIHRVQFRWVRGHAGNRENERCDQLSLAARRKGNLPPDEGYEKVDEAESVSVLTGAASWNHNQLNSKLH